MISTEKFRKLDSDENSDLAGTPYLENKKSSIHDASISLRSLLYADMSPGGGLI